MEWKLFNKENIDFVSSDWYKDRESAHHLEESTHIERLLITKDFVLKAINMGGKTIVDLGCGDGGLLYLIKDEPYKSWGYDLMPTNIDYAKNVRLVDARYTDFKNNDIEYADIAVMTEVLEHLEDPHKTIKNLPSKFLIASSPYIENDESHYEYHLWAWDVEGYKELIENNGYKVIDTKLTEWSQILLCIKETNE